ncbi:MAG: hypothetical protein LC664_07515, partial [Flavobacteriales bacterium]|nr:hypothetical protein [Flavobacteriales bacterium]
MTYLFKSRLLVGILLFFTFNSYAQNNFWTFPEEYWVPGAFSPNNLPTTTFSYTGGSSDFVHAGLRDPYGEELFFVMDGYIYDQQSGQEEFQNDINERIRGHSEVLIIPKPDSCDQFYIFQSSAKYPGTNMVEAPYVSEYHRDIGLLKNSNYQSAFSLIDDVEVIDPDDWNDDDDDHGLHGIHFAATRERYDGSRWVFVSNNQNVFRVDVTCNGLQETG